MNAPAPSLQTLTDLVFHIRDISAGRPNLLTFRGERRESLSASDFLRGVHSLALALESRGLKAGDRVAIISEARPEWHLVDFACQLIGAVTVPMDPDAPGELMGYILRNSGCRWAFYGWGDTRKFLITLQRGLTTPVRLVSMAGDGAAPDSLTLTRLMGEGAPRQGEVPVERFRGRTQPDDLASLLYTSGTTGDPKGVMLSQKSLVANLVACGKLFTLGPTDLAITFLSPSHGFQRTIDHLCFYRGVAMHYVPNSDDMPEALRQERPTLLVALPRIYERAHRRTFELIDQDPGWRQRLSHWAIGVGRRYLTASRDGFISPLLALERRFAESFAFGRIQQRFGGRLRFALCGGGALAAEVSDFFEAVGVPIDQGYGLAESSPVLTSNAPRQRRHGSVGKALEEVELRLADDGEILARGPGVMMGYWENPDATAETFDDSGWLRTGDVGHIDQSGYVFITARKQDLLITHDGQSVAPQPLEETLTQDGLIRQAMVIGDNRPYLVALLVPDYERLSVETGEDEPAVLAASPRVQQAVERRVEMVNERQKDAPKILRFAVLTEGFQERDGEVTLSGELRRRNILQRRAEMIAGLYSAQSVTPAADPADPPAPDVSSADPTATTSSDP